MTNDFMMQALSLANKALGNVSPNPAVGAVVVKNGEIVGEGFTQAPGSAHAEIVALGQAGDSTKGATLYATMEPCCHHGRTPPCTAAIISSGIKTVHVAMTDPNPLVSAKGKKDLEEAGITVISGEFEQEARDLNESYIKHITTGIPFITAKYAMSLDGKIATKTHDSKWISNQQSRARVHQIRYSSDAIMVGVNTILNDNPELTARDGNRQKQPLRIVVDSYCRTSPSAHIFQIPGKTLIATTKLANSSSINQYEGLEAEVLPLPSQNNRVDLNALLKALGERQITSILVEGGGQLLGSLFDLQLVDKVIIFIAPKIIGGKESLSPIAGEGIAKMAQAMNLNRLKVDRLEDDIMITGYTR